MHQIICEDCKEQYQLDETYAKKISLPKGVTLYRGAGCKACNNTGFKGRTGIYELLLVDSNLRRILFQKASFDDVFEAAKKNGMKTLRENGMEKVLQGVTTIEEVLSITESGF